MRPPHGPGTHLTLSGTITPASLGMLCARLGDLLTAGLGQPVVCDVSRLAADLGAVDVLGRLQLDARRRGGAVALTGVSGDLEDLLEICGLAGAIPRVDRAGGRVAD